MTRVVIVGAGVIGLSCAHTLRKAGAEVVLLDKGEPGFGSSFGNAGWIVPSLAGPMPSPGLGLTSLTWLLKKDSPLHISPAALPKLAGFLWTFWRHCNAPDYLSGQRSVGELGRSTMSLFDELEKEGTSFEMHRDGLIFVFRDPATLHHVRKDLENMKPYGYEVPDPLSGAEVRKLEPALSGDVVGGLLVKEERHVRPESLNRGLLERVKELGVEVRTQAEVGDVVRANGRLTAVVTGDGPVEGDHFVIAAGAWTAPLGRVFGYSVPVEAGKGYSVTFERSAVRIHRPLYLGEVKVGVTPYDGGLRIAGTMELSGINERLDGRRVDAIRRNAEKYLPGVSQAGAGEEWVGMRPLTPDGLPLIGRVPGADNIYMATGHAMLGMTLAPATAAVIGELIMGGESTLDITPFDPGRFGDVALSEHTT
jgi:D-amino-acid dehydrogenase